MHDPVEPRAEQQDDVGVLQRESAPGRDRERVFVVDDTLAHRRAQEGQLGGFDEGAQLCLGPRIRRSLADDDERSFGAAQHLDGTLHIARIGLGSRRIGTASRKYDLVLFQLGRQEVVGKVEVDRTGSPADAGSHGLLDVEGNAARGVRSCGVFRVDAPELDLGGFLERAAALLVGVARAAEQDHRPAVGLRVREACDAVDHAGAGDREAGGRSTREIADCGCGVAGGLFVSHPEELDSLVLGGHGEPEYRESDDAEHLLDALFLQTAGEQGVSIDRGHWVLLVSGSIGL